jgi:hypothetical protein
MLTAIWMTLALSGALGPTGPRMHSTVTVEARGVGYPPARMRQPQARLMARRAAEVGAVRTLYRQINPANPVQGIPFRYVSSVTRPDGSVVVRATATLPRR